MSSKAALEMLRSIALLILWLPIKLLRVVSVLIVVALVMELVQMREGVGNTLVAIGGLLAATAIRLALPVAHSWLRKAGS